MLKAILGHLAPLWGHVGHRGHVGGLGQRAGGGTLCHGGPCWAMWRACRAGDLGGM